MLKSQATDINQLLFTTAREELIASLKQRFSMKTGFHDPIAIKNEKKTKPYSFEQPKYDERSSCFVNTGSHYGVGHRQPVGHDGKVKQSVPCMPMGRVNTLRVDSKSMKNESLDIEK